MAAKTLFTLSPSSPLTPTSRMMSGSAGSSSGSSNAPSTSSSCNAGNTLNVNSESNALSVLWHDDRVDDAFIEEADAFMVLTLPTAPSGPDSDERNILISDDPAEGAELLNDGLLPLHEHSGSSNKADTDPNSKNKATIPTLMSPSLPLHFLSVLDRNDEQQQIQGSQSLVGQGLQFSKDGEELLQQQELLKQRQQELELQLKEQQRQQLLHHHQRQQKHWNSQHEQHQKQLQHEQQQKQSQQFQQQHSHKNKKQDSGSPQSLLPQSRKSMVSQVQHQRASSENGNEKTCGTSSITFVNKNQNLTTVLNVVNSGSRPQLPLNRPLGQFRCLQTDLETVPEDSVPENPVVFTPLVPPAILSPSTTNYNISYPSALKAKPIQFFRPPILTNRPSNPSPSNCSPGGSSQQSPFHGATQTSPFNAGDFEPMNVLEEDLKPATTPTVPLPNSNTAVGSRTDGSSTPVDQKCDCHKLAFNCSSSASSSSKAPIKHACKRSRSDPPPPFLFPLDDDEPSDGATSRQRRKSNPGSNETKRRDCIKLGLEELQRVLPHIGKPEDERISQASVLHEGGKFIKAIKQESETLVEEIRVVNEDIEDLKKEIEALQSQLPENGAPLLPKVMSIRRLADQFHDHVVRRTNEDWHYWLFTQIMGHFVHSFDDEVKSATHEELSDSATQWMAKNLSLTQLRSDAYRKLAKLTRKTSILSTPSKLPEESLKFVSHGLIPADERIKSGKSWRGERQTTNT